MVDWPSEMTPLLAGWKFEEGLLVSPDGATYEPGSILYIAQIAQLRGVNERSARRMFMGAQRQGQKILAVPAAEAVAQRRSAGRPLGSKNARTN